MAKVTIYTTPICPYCRMAKQLLERKSIVFDEIDVQDDPERRREMRAKASGRNTVPQIWIGERHVGGCDDLYDLDHAGELDALVAG